MSDTCVNALECCDLAIWQPPPPGFQGQLSGLLWQMPCAGNVTWPLPFSCDTVDPPDDVQTLIGTPGDFYDVTLLIRAVFEMANYTGGTIIPSLNNMLVAGAAPVLDGHNIYSLIVSNPAQTYYINRYDAVGGLNPNNVYAFRYTATISIAAGASVTLRARGINGGQVTNFNGEIITLTPGDPPIRVVQNPIYDTSGQFAQVDAIGII